MFGSFGWDTVDNDSVFYKLFYTSCVLIWFIVAAISCNMIGVACCIYFYMMQCEFSQEMSCSVISNSPIDSQFSLRNAQSVLDGMYVSFVDSFVLQFSMLKISWLMQFHLSLRLCFHCSGRIVHISFGGKRDILQKLQNIRTIQ